MTSQTTLMHSTMVKFRSEVQRKSFWYVCLKCQHFFFDLFISHLGHFRHWQLQPVGAFKEMQVYQYCLFVGKCPFGFAVDANIYINTNCICIYSTTSMTVQNHPVM